MAFITIYFTFACSVAFAKDLDEARDTIANKKMNIFFMIYKINRPKLMLYHKKQRGTNYSTCS